MSNKWKIRTVLLILLIVLSTPLFAQMETPLFSAYGACRVAAMFKKGYGVWIYQHREMDLIFAQTFFFDDGINVLTCPAVGVGPFWISLMAQETLSGVSCHGNEQSCPKWDYHGVSP